MEKQRLALLEKNRKLSKINAEMEKEVECCREMNENYEEKAKKMRKEIDHKKSENKKIGIKNQKLSNQMTYNGDCDILAKLVFNFFRIIFN